MRKIIAGDLKLLINMSDPSVQRGYYRIGNQNISNVLGELLKNPIRTEFEYPDGDTAQVFTSTGSKIKITIETEDEGSCVKCGHNEHTIEFCHNPACKYEFVDEIGHLHYICKQCKYIWIMPTLDRLVNNDNNDINDIKLDDPRDTNLK